MDAPFSVVVVIHDSRDELDRLLKQLERLPLQEAAKADRVAFAEVFHQLYTHELGVPLVPTNRGQ